MKPVLRGVLFAAVVAVLLTLGLLVRWALQPPPPAVQTVVAAGQGMPWQIETLPDGTSRVMGLHLGADTLAQVRARAGEAMQVGLVARLDEVGKLEALVEPFLAGFISGRLVMSFEVPVDTLRRWRQGATGSAPMDDGVRRFSLRAQDAAEAETARLVAISYIPLVRLSEADVVQRFGTPDSRHALADGAALLLYRRQGLAAAVAEGQRGLLQYVAPRDGARLDALVPPAAR